MITMVIVLAVLTVLNLALQYRLSCIVRAHGKRIDDALAAKQAFRGGCAELRARLDKRFGVRV